MARALSTMLELGTTAPGFSLPNSNLLVPAKQVSFERGAGQCGTLVVFICNHCPYVVLIADAFREFATEYITRGIAVIAINPNDVETYPEDHPDRMAEFARRHAFNFPYLHDADQSVARSYNAACTPDLYLFDTDGKLVYRGQFDGARPGNGVTPDGNDIRLAAKDLIARRSISVDQVPSMGCSIKWKPGNEPAYFPAQ